MEENIYLRGKIYRIVSNVSSKQYIGSTVQVLSERFRGHKKDYEKSKTKEHTKCSVAIMFDTDGVDNCEIVLIEDYPCNSKDELHRRERYWIEKEECVNICIPTQTPKEWRERNKEILKEKKNRHCDCECGGKYVWDSKRRHERTAKHQKIISSNCKDAVRDSEE